MMQSRLTVVALSMFAGLAMGALAVEGIRAQTASAVYYIVEADVANSDGYLKEYLPRIEASMKAFGGRILASGSKVASVEGEPPKPHVTIVTWEDIENLQNWRGSAQFKEIRVVGDKYARFRAFTVEGLPQ